MLLLTVYMRTMALVRFPWDEVYAGWMVIIFSWLC